MHCVKRRPLLDERPDLLAEWDADLNEVTPSEVMSRDKVWWSGACGHAPYLATVNHRKSRGDGCPTCAGKRVEVGVNDLASRCPLVAAQWIYERNGSATPETVAWSSNRRYWWACAHEHAFLAPVNRRTGVRPSGCPTCSGHRVDAGANDLATVAPGVAADWHADLNGSLRPTDVTAGSGVKPWWKCPIGHAPYQAQVCDRTRSNPKGCPTCAGHRLERGVNDLVSQRPEVAAEWDIERNAKGADEVFVQSSSKAWWKPKCGHDPYYSSIRNRTSAQASGCPQCAREDASRIERALFEVVASAFPSAEHGALMDAKWCSPGKTRARRASVDIVARDGDQALVVEYDGAWYHQRRAGSDLAKTEALLAAGYRVVRVRSDGLEHLPLQHPRLLQLNYAQRHGRHAVDAMKRSLAPVVRRIEEFASASA